MGGVYIREDVGGSALTRLDAALIFEALAIGCPTVSAYISIHNMAAWMIDRFGSDEQRRQLLPKLVTMEHLASYCLTEPGRGLRRRGAEDPRGARRRPLRARRSEAVHLGGRRRRSLRRHGADRRRGAVRHLDARRRPATRPASRFGANERKMGWNAQPTRAVIFDGARVPVENRLGPEGIGFKIAMAGLDGGRLNIAACSVGGAQAAFDKALGYMRERRAFGKALTEFQALQFRLADMATELEAARLFLYAAAAAYDREEPDATHALRDGEALRDRHRLQGRERRPSAPRRLRLSLRVRHREDRPRPAGSTRSSKARTRSCA